MSSSSTIDDMALQKECNYVERADTINMALLKECNCVEWGRRL